MITGRSKVLVFSGCYHGGVEEAHVEIRDGRVGLRNMIHPNGIDHAAVTRVVEFNDVVALEAALAHGDVACVLAEPLMTNFGMIPVDPGFHRALRELTRRTGTVLIIDETHTLSCGPGGYTGLHRLEPDIFVAGKAIAGGIPAGVFGLNQEIAERLWAIVPLRQSARAPVGASRYRRHARRQCADGRDHARGAGKGADRRELRPDDRNCDAARRGRPWTDRGQSPALACDADRRTCGDHVHAATSRETAPTSSPAGRRRLETLLHAFYMNEGILVTPFHTMLLMCPATSVDDVARHTAVVRSASSTSCARLGVI